MAFRHRMRVANVVMEAPGVVSIYVTGRELDRLPVRAGQFFIWRFLAGDGGGGRTVLGLGRAERQVVALTVKERGDDTGWLQGITMVRPSWQRVHTARSRGRCEPDRASSSLPAESDHAPEHSYQELAPQRGALTLTYCASRWEDVVFRAQIDSLMKARGWTVRYLIGRRDQGEVAREPLDAAHLRALVPDVAKRDVFISGPDSINDAVRAALRRLDVPSRQIHTERFSFQARSATFGAAPARLDPLPLRAVVAIVTTALGLVLLFSFRTPDSVPPRTAGAVAFPDDVAPAQSARPVLVG